MKTLNELEGSLMKLLSTLQRNRDGVGVQILKTHYTQAYEHLILQINQAATAYAKALTLRCLPINPDVPLETQIAVINQTIADSGLLEAMGKSLSTYHTAQLRLLALKLRNQIEAALQPFVDLKNCLVADLYDLEKEPIIYNTLTHQIFTDRWVDREISLEGKLLIYIKPENEQISREALAEREELIS